MRPILLFLFLLTAFTGAAQWFPQANPLHKKNFKKVAAKKYTMAFEYELVEGEKILARVVEFGAAGLPAALYEKGVNENGDSTNTFETIYKFDGAGRLIRESNTDNDGEGWDNVYTYSKNDKLLKKYTVTIDPATTSYTYNAAGKLTKTFTTLKMPALNEDGEPTGKTVEKPHERKTFSYDKNGRLKEQFVYNLMYAEGAKKWSYKMLWTFNTSNQLIKLQYINDEGETYNLITFQYNKDGLLIKSTMQADEEPLKRFVYEYCTTCKQSWMQ